MKKIPNEIFIQAVVAPDWDIEECNWFERTWSTKRVHEDDIVFVKKHPNQENTTDTKLCNQCRSYKAMYPSLEVCPTCNRALNQ